RHPEGLGVRCNRGARQLTDGGEGCRSRGVVMHESGRVLRGRISEATVRITTYTHSASLLAALAGAPSPLRDKMSRGASWIRSRPEPRWSHLPLEARGLDDHRTRSRAPRHGSGCT